MSKGGFPAIAETTRSELADTSKLAEQFPVIAWVWQFINTNLTDLSNKDS